MNLSDLKEAKYNPRTISDKAFSGLKISLDRFGDLSGITFNTHTGNLVCGHQRIKELKEKYGDLEVKEDKIITPDGKIFKVRFVDWDIKKEKAANIAANNQMIAGEFTSDLKLVIDEIKLDTPDLTKSLRFDELKIPERELTEEEAKKLDEVPEINEEPISQTGDIFLLNNKHLVMCGDSTKKEDVEKLMGDKKADMVFTDPPYGVDYEGKTKDKLKIKSDNLDEEGLTKAVKKWFDLVDYASRDGATFLATVPPGPLHLIFAADWKARGWLRQIMVWNKDSMVLGHSEYHYKHEPILFGWKEGERIKNGDRTKTTVWEFKRPKASREHPTMKPIEMWIYGVKNHSKINNIIYEPFFGSGTTLIACEQTNRICYGIEIDPIYVDVILKRYHEIYPGKEIKCLNRNYNFEKLFENTK